MPQTGQAIPYERTTCACDDCVRCCKEQPGPLVPGDMERIAAHLGVSMAEAKGHFWSSPGALVMDTATGRQFRVRTITPRAVRGRCVFLGDDDRCRVHPVAPAGCAYFDTHMQSVEAHRRAVAVVRLQQDEDYQRLRQELPVADSYRPKAW